MGDPAEFEEVEDVIIERRPELAQVSVRIPSEDLAALRQQADRAVIGYTTSIRMILRDHLNASHGAKRVASFQAATPGRPAYDPSGWGVGSISAQQGNDMYNTNRRTSKLREETGDYQDQNKRT